MRVIVIAWVAVLIWFAGVAVLDVPNPLSPPSAPAAEVEHRCGMEDEFGWVPLICGNHQGNMILRGEV